MPEKMSVEELARCWHHRLDCLGSRPGHEDECRCNYFSEIQPLLAHIAALEADNAKLREALREAVETVKFPCAECKPFIDAARQALTQEGDQNG